MDEYNRSPLHYVCIDNAPDSRLEIATNLIALGHDINALDNDNWSPLHFAAQANCPEVINLLIEKGANIEAKEINGNTPLWVATMNSSQGSQAVDVLVDSGSNPDEKNIHDISPRDIEAGLFNNKHNKIG